MSNSCDPMDCSHRLLCPWDSPATNTGLGCHFLLQGIFLTQELNLGLLRCRQILYRLSYKGISSCEVELLTFIVFEMKTGKYFTYLFIYLKIPWVNSLHMNMNNTWLVKNNSVFTKRKSMRRVVLFYHFCKPL